MARRKMAQAAPAATNTPTAQSVSSSTAAPIAPRTRAAGRMSRTDKDKTARNQEVTDGHVSGQEAQGSRKRHARAVEPTAGAKRPVKKAKQAPTKQANKNQHATKKAQLVIVESDGPDDDIAEHISNAAAVAKIADDDLEDGSSDYTTPTDIEEELEKQDAEEEEQQLKRLKQRNPERLKRATEIERPLWDVMDHREEATKAKEVDALLDAGLNTGAASTTPTLPAPAPLGNDHISRTIQHLLGIADYDPHVSDAGGPIAAGAIRFPEPKSSTDSGPVWPALTDLVLPAGSGRISLTAQQGLVRKVVTDSFDHLFALLVTRNAYPDTGLRTQFTRDALVISAAACPGASEIHQRLLRDLSYTATLSSIPNQRISLFRGDIKESCCNAVVGMHQLVMGSGAKDSAERKLNQYTYIFPLAGPGGLTGPPVRSRPYRHPMIHVIIGSHFFSGNPSFAVRHDHLFSFSRDDESQLVKEVPKAMVALVATAIYAALYEWRTGEHRSMDFSANTYADVYNGHIATLEHIEAKRPESYRHMMADIYSAARASLSSASTNPAVDTSIAEVDLDNMATY